MAEDFSDDDFDAGDADSAFCHPGPVGDVKKNSFVALKGMVFSFFFLRKLILYFPLGRPAKVVETSISKTGKHGHAKMHIVAIDIFNGKKYEALYPTSHNIPVPDIERADYQLINIEDGFLSLMLENGSTREDLKLPEGEVGEKLQAAFDDGKDILVSTMKAMGIEQVMSFKEI